jgi:hypothetical protein
MSTITNDETFFKEGRFIVPVLSKDIGNLKNLFAAKKQNFTTVLSQRERSVQSKLTGTALEIHKATKLSNQKLVTEKLNEALNTFIASSVKEKVTLDKCILQQRESIMSFGGLARISEDTINVILSAQTPNNEKTMIIHNLVYPDIVIDNVIDSFFHPVNTELNKQQQLSHRITTDSYQFTFSKLDKELAIRNQNDASSVFLHSYVMFNAYSLTLMTLFMKAFKRLTYCNELIAYQANFKSYKIHTYLIDLLANATKTPETIESWPPYELIAFNSQEAIESLDDKVASLTALNAAEEQKKKDTKAALKIKILSTAKGVPSSSLTVTQSSNMGDVMMDIPSVADVITTAVKTVLSSKQKRPNSSPGATQVGVNTNKKQRFEAKHQANPSPVHPQHNSYQGNRGGHGTKGRGGVWNRGGRGGRQSIGNNTKVAEARVKVDTSATPPLISPTLASSPSPHATSPSPHASNFSSFPSNVNTNVAKHATSQ